MKCYAYDAFFETIANKTRLEMIDALKDKSMSVSELCNTLNQEQSKISHNLKILTDCRVLYVKKKGKQRIYSVNKETILPLIKLVEEHVRKNCKTCSKRK
ncbi:winged helix-turn-helix transcriptional regulator [Candidatus Woesearchaeota archaeon]|nr:winged helix-turn-helix transcriptional regulator [Candidatus Woesearchaeota archaeon]